MIKAGKKTPTEMKCLQQHSSCRQSGIPEEEGNLNLPTKTRDHKKSSENFFHKTRSQGKDYMPHKMEQIVQIN